jgi:cation diffusion facilitator family transporter
MVAAGMLAGSTALLALGVHAAVGPLAAIIAWWAGRAAARPADEEHVFGHGKVADVVMVVEGVSFLGLAGFLAWLGADRLRQPVPVLFPGLCLGLAVLAALMEYLFLRFLHRRGYGRKWPIAPEVWQPAMGLLSSVVVVVGLVLQLLFPGAPVDPALAVIVAFVIVISGLQLIRRSFQQLLDVSLPAGELAAVKACLVRHGREIVDYSDMRTRRSGGDRFVNFNLILPRHLSIEQAHRLCEQLEDEIGAALADCRATIHCEPCGWDEKEPCPGNDCHAAEACASLTGQGPSG